MLGLKCLSKGRACHGGNAKFSLPVHGKPGGWTARIHPDCCRSGWHLCSLMGLERFFVHKYPRRSCEIYLAEGEGSGNGDWMKRAFTRVRLLRKLRLNKRTLRKSELDRFDYHLDRMCDSEELSRSEFARLRRLSALQRLLVTFGCLLRFSVWQTGCGSYNYHDNCLGRVLWSVSDSLYYKSKPSSRWHMLCGFGNHALRFMAHRMGLTEGEAEALRQF